MLRSETYACSDTSEVNEDYKAKGWTDGLPIVPPTMEKVEEMLDFAGLTPDFVLGGMPERKKVFTAEKVAVNAVMAGCLPNYFPVVVAALTAMSDEKFNLHGPTASTQGPGILVILNGPVIDQLGLNSGQNVLGPGTHANMTIGRAIRLVLHNLGGGRAFDRSTFGHPGKMSFCIAEKETDWTPLHVERGFEDEQSTVTVMAAEGPNQIQNNLATEPESLLKTVADHISIAGTSNMLDDQQLTLVLSPEHYATCRTCGWDKTMVKEFLYAHTKRSVAALKSCGAIPGKIEEKDSKTYKTAIPAPNDIILLVAGGEAGRFSAWMPGWGSKQQTQAITRAIKSCTGGG